MRDPLAPSPLNAEQEIPLALSPLDVERETPCAVSHPVTTEGRTPNEISLSHTRGERGDRQRLPSPASSVTRGDRHNVVQSLLRPLSPPHLSPNTTTNAEGKESKRLKTVIIIVLPMVVVVVLIILIASIFILLRARKQRVGVASSEVDDSSDLETLVFDISTIRTATDDFSDANIIGEGGYGAVYKIWKPC